MARSEYQDAIAKEHKQWTETTTKYRELYEAAQQVTIAIDRYGGLMESEPLQYEQHNILHAQVREAELAFRELEGRDSE